MKYSTVDKNDEFRREHLTKTWFDVSAEVSGVDKDKATISFEASAKVPSTHVLTGVRVFEGYATSGTPVYSSETSSGSVDLTGLAPGKEQVYTLVAYGTPVADETKEVEGYAIVKWAQPETVDYSINFNGNLNQGFVMKPFVKTTAASKPGCTTYAVTLFGDFNDAWYANACTLTLQSEAFTSGNTESVPVVLNGASCRHTYIPLTADNFRNADGMAVADIKVGLGMRFAEIYLHVDDTTGQMWLSLPRGQREAVDFQPEVALDGRMDADHSYGWAFRTGTLLSYNENRITTYNPIFDTPLTYPESGMIVRCANLRFPTAYTVALDGGARSIMFTEADNTGKGYYERVFPIASIDDLKAIFNREGNGAGAKFCCDIAAPGIAFDAVGYDMTLDPATSMPTEVRIRIYNEQPDLASLLDPARKNKTSFSLNYWHSDIFKTLGGGDHYFTYDHTDADDDTGTVYDYYVIPVHDDMTGVDPEQFVVQCAFTNHAQSYMFYPGQAEIDNEYFQIKVKDTDNIRFYFDMRNNDTWTKVQRYDERVGNSRIKFGAMAKNIWLRVNTDPNVNIYDKYEVMYDTSGDAIDNRPVEAPIDNSRYTMLVPKGSPLYNLMRGTIPASEDNLVLYFNKHIASDYWYQINLGRNIKFTVEQPFSFLINGENQNVQFTVDGYENIKANRAVNSVIHSGLEGNRLMLHVKYNYISNKYEYEFRLHKLGDAFPSDWERASDPDVTVKHSQPIFKAWTGNAENNGEDFIYGMSRIESIPHYVDGAANYFTFAYVYKDKGDEKATWSYTPIEGRTAHPNVFYMNLRDASGNGIKVNADMADKLASGGFNFGYDENAAGMDHLAFFNIMDEDGYDVANPGQGGQWFFGNTWWCANRYIVPEKDIHGNQLDPNSSQYWIPDVRPKTGTRGDLVYADHGENATIYGITIFRIAGTKYDMYRPAGAKMVEGNYYYLYFNTNPDKQGPELTMPISINVNGSYPEGEVPDIPVLHTDQYEFYHPSENPYPVRGRVTLVDGKYVSDFGGELGEEKLYNRPEFAGNIPSEAVPTIKNGWPALVVLDHVDRNGDAIYRLDLDAYQPKVDEPFTVAAVTRSIAWAGDRVNDKLRVSKWSRYMTAQGKQPTEYRASVINNTKVTYSQLLIGTNADQLRVQLKSTVPNLSASVISDFCADETQWAHQPLVYPEFNAEVSWVIDSENGFYQGVSEQQPLYIRLFVKEFEKDENGDFVTGANDEYIRAKVDGPKTYVPGTEGYYAPDPANKDDENEPDSEAFGRYKITKLDVDQEKMQVTMIVDGNEITLPIYDENNLEDVFLNEGEYLVSLPVSFLMDASKVNEVYATLSWSNQNSIPRKSNVVSELNYVYLTPHVSYNDDAEAIGVGTRKADNTSYGANLVPYWSANEDVAVLPYRKRPEYFYSASSNEWLGKLEVNDNASRPEIGEAILNYEITPENFDQEVADHAEKFSEYVYKDGLAWAHNAVSFGDSRLTDMTDPNSPKFETHIGFLTMIERSYCWPDVPVIRRGELAGYSDSQILQWAGEEGRSRAASDARIHTFGTVAHKVIPFVELNISGIEDVAGEADAPVEYYNLQGVRLANPTPGTIVIRRQGSKATKIRY